MSFDKTVAACFLVIGLFILFAARHPLIPASDVDVAAANIFGAIFISTAAIVFAISNIRSKP